MGRFLAALCAGVFAFAFAGLAAQAQKVTIGYQQIYNPWKVAIVGGKFEKATGAKIKWVGFDSGAKVINAMASGDVQIAVAGSSPIAAGVSHGLDIELFWIVQNIASAEALVVRNGSGIEKPGDLNGKKVATPFVSTSHYQLMYYLKRNNVDNARVLDMQPNAIAAAWERGDIDAAFVWGPALSRIQKTGKVLTTSGDIAKLGAPTFDGMVVNKGFAKAHPDFMVEFVKTIAAADEVYRSNPDSFGPDSENAKKIVKMMGGTPKDVKSTLDLYEFLTLKQQASKEWLGGGAAQALHDTADFLKEQKKIDKLLPDYSAVVTDEYVKKAM
jgi:taurine transport system substrate-binding protein